MGMMLIRRLKRLLRKILFDAVFMLAAMTIPRPTCLFGHL